MALVNPCEKCQAPNQLAYLSSTIEEMLSSLSERNAQELKRISAAEMSPFTREKTIGFIAKMGVFMVELQAVAERANHVSCDVAESCQRASFVMEAYASASDSILADLEGPSYGGKPPQPPGND